MKKTVLIVGGIALVIVAIAGFYFWNKSNQNKPPQVTTDTQTTKDVTQTTGLAGIPGLGDVLAGLGL